MIFTLISPATNQQPVSALSFDCVDCVVFPQSPMSAVSTGTSAVIAAVG